jgi:hypothetical protein
MRHPHAKGKATVVQTPSLATSPGADAVPIYRVHLARLLSERDWRDALAADLVGARLCSPRPGGDAARRVIASWLRARTA